MLKNHPQTCFKKSDSNTAEATCDLIGNRISIKITKNLLQNTSETVENETEIPRERYLYPEKGRTLLMI